MAKVTFGPIVAEARNKVGGVVFSRNPYGAFSRAWFVPPYSNTAPQAGLRAAMTSLSRRWGSTLTDEQRAGWRDLGFRYKHVDVFKQKCASPGLQAFMKANMALYSVGYGPVDEPPLRQRASDPLGITVSATSGTTPAIQIDPINDPGVDEAVQLWITPQLSPGRNYFFRHMRMVSTELAGTPGPWDASAGWSSRFGALTYPSKLGVGVRYINTVTGAIGPWRTNLNTVTECGFTMLKTTVPVSDADFKTLRTTPVVLLPALAAGSQYVIFFSVLQFNAGAAPYAGADATAGIQVEVSGIGATNVLLNDATDFITSLTDFLLFPSTPALAAPAEVNSPDWITATALRFTGALANVTLSAFNSIDFTGGDPANVLSVTLYYDIIPVP